MNETFRNKKRTVLAFWCLYRNISLALIHFFKIKNCYSVLCQPLKFVPSISNHPVCSAISDSSYMNNILRNREMKIAIWFIGFHIRHSKAFFRLKGNVIVLPSELWYKVNRYRKINAIIYQDNIINIASDKKI